MAIEIPKYRVIERIDDVEIREYPSTLVAETEVENSHAQAGNQAFRRLAGYIFGNNRAAEKIAMTAPVTQSRSGTKIAMTAPVTQVASSAGRYIVRFTMPAHYTRDALPEPVDPNVSIKEQPAARWAVKRYAGTWSTRNFERQLALLRTSLVRAGIATRGEPTWARYNPPWTPWFMRRNEVMLELAP